MSPSFPHGHFPRGELTGASAGTPHPTRKPDTGARPVCSRPALPPYLPAALPSPSRTPVTSARPHPHEQGRQSSGHTFHRAQLSCVL